MRHSTKSMLKSALVLFCTGLIITTSCYIYAAANGIDVYGSSSLRPIYDSYSETIDEILARSPDAAKNANPSDSYPPFSAIEVFSQVGDIAIKKTNSASYIEYENVDKNNLKCIIEGDKLSVSEINPVMFMGVSVKKDGIAFDGLRQIFNRKATFNPNRKITLYINEAKPFLSVSVKANIGDIEMDGISAYKIELNLSYGTAKVHNTTVIPGTNESIIRINGDIASIEFSDNSYPICDISVISGNIHASVSESKSNFETTLGTISVVTSSELSDYTVRMSTNYGDVKIQGKKVTDKNEYNHQGATASSIWIKAGAGNISVSSQSVISNGQTSSEEPEITATETNTANEPSPTGEIAN
ncbi:MAG: DUF4097 family beta strand repeat-containing protein [Oscillospiraceae bacterium]|nr:DUF4097 family beta strand repeat-containing protein [Oscillospiraceae bacterium]